jgi:Tfp pilus assembly protein PilF
VAAVFAVHPLHVESVAWASERKDVLSGFLAVGVMLAYVSYAKKPGWGRYLGVLTLYALGLMAKQMLVTLPFLLLLLDYWPLRRLKSGVGNDEGGHTSLSGSSAPVGARQIVLEKIPLLALAVLASVIVFQVQTATGVVKSLDVIPLGMRSGNAVLSYVRYLWKILFPVKLAIFYPYPQPPLPLWQPAGAGFLLLLLAGVGLAVRKSHPYLMVGWGWFLGMLIPVIGLVQVGVQSMADRYAYLPAMGVYVIVAWGVRDLAIKLRVRVQVAVALALLGLLACGVVTRIQVAYWRNSMTLYAHACDVVPGNYWAHYNLGVEMERQGRGDEALAQYAEAVRIKPDFPEAHYNMGVALAARGRRGDAARHYLEAIRVKPRYARALCNLAAIVAEQGNLGEATRYYERALQADSRLAEAHIGLGIISEAQGDIETAVFRYREALRIRPDWECAADRLRNSLTRLPSKAHSKEPR